MVFLCLVVSAFAGGSTDGVREALGPLYKAAPYLCASPRRGPRKGLDSVRRWNEIAINASGLDHTPAGPGESRVFGEQFGPCRSSRALAIVHIAMFDTVISVVGGYESYSGVRAPSGPLSMQAAISEAAHDTLAALYPSQEASFDARLAENLDGIHNEKAEAKGIDLGKRAAAAILALRAHDGSQHSEPFVGIDYLTCDLPGMWRQDPISRIPLALGGHWGECAPFVLQAS